MRSFWISLLVFILLMCSCRSKKVVSDVKLDTQYTSETSYLNKSVEIDTTKTAYSTQLSEFKLLHETITETEYDTDKNVAKKVTETKRTFVQDTQTDIAEEEQKRVEIHSRDTLGHFRGSTKKVESETEIMTENQGLNPFGKYSGIVIGLVIGLIIVYLLDKMRIN